MLLGCGSRQATPTEDWSGFTPEAAAALKTLVAQHGRGGPLFNAAAPPRVTLDWDNTMMRQDMGDALMAHALTHNGLLQPAGKDWANVSLSFTPEAVAALHAACDGAGEPGQPLKSVENPACAAEVWSIYAEDRTEAGAPAWTSPDNRTVKHGYALGAQLLAGQRPQDVKATTTEVFLQASKAPLTETWRMGPHSLPAWVRINTPMARLVTLMQSRGFDVWVVSASPQPVVEAVAAQVGIAADHVVGIRNLLDAKGRLTSRLEACGVDLPPDSVITYQQGKRCFINKSILKLPPEQHMAAAPQEMRQVFAAGDSDTDLFMLLDATGLRLAINRNKPELMCHAYNNQDGRWAVQPMFLDPLPRREPAYACASFSVAGSPPLADQEDRVHAP